MARVLVVEDDGDIRDLVSARLRSLGHRVVGVGDAAAAVAMIDDKGVPDVLLLDVGLPDVDGFTLLSQLRSRPDCADVPAIFLSARVQEADIERGRTMGATYLTKPFVASALLNAVEKAVAAREADAGW